MPEKSGCTESRCILLLVLSFLLHTTQDGAIPQSVDVCVSVASKYWIPVLLAYKGLFLVVGLWLAATTYRVKIKQLRDSKLIVACVVSISLVSLVLTLITFVLPTGPNARYGVIGSFILVLVTVVLFLLFVTRVSVGNLRFAPYV